MVVHLVESGTIYIVTIVQSAHGNRVIFTGSAVELAVESAYSTAESAYSTTKSVMVGQLPLSNMINILDPLELADGKLAKWVRACHPARIAGSVFG